MGENKESEHKVGFFSIMKSALFMLTMWLWRQAMLKSAG